MSAEQQIDGRIAFFDSIADAWDGWHDLPLLEARLQAEFDALGVQRGECVLDIGCGTGNLTKALLSRLDSAGRVFAVDISPVMLERAQNKINDPRVCWLQGAAHQLPLADGSCDRIICFSAWPHFEDPEAVLAEFGRVLRAGGHVQILHYISREEVNQIHSEAHPSVQADLLAPASEVAVLFERNGFEVLSVADDASCYALNACKGRCL
ncbi:MAG: class I SAM-dependent methyltransferase [Kiritimatiellae bacterium]|nr:class I SAM-dependent methyltransferase [Kiritimatiellia bacterium]